jgi:hypothetical protein
MVNSQRNETNQDFKNTRRYVEAACKVLNILPDQIYVFHILPRHEVVERGQHIEVEGTRGQCIIIGYCESILQCNNNRTRSCQSRLARCMTLSVFRPLISWCMRPATECSDGRARPVHIREPV